jgi:hypothetical protein
VVGGHTLNKVFLAQSSQLSRLPLVPRSSNPTPHHKQLVAFPAGRLRPVGRRSVPRADSPPAVPASGCIACSEDWKGEVPATC